MARLNKERQQELEPKRLLNAIETIEAYGYSIHYKDDKEIRFMYKGNQILFFPYSGWHTGKGIKDGRGLQQLLLQIKK